MLFMYAECCFYFYFPILKYSKEKKIAVHLETHLLIYFRTKVIRNVTNSGSCWEDRL